MFAHLLICKRANINEFNATCPFVMLKILVNIKIYNLFECSPSSLYLVQGRHTSFLGDHQKNNQKCPLDDNCQFLTVGAP